ncbi:MAG: ATP-binding protein [Armatimonadota bacterium]
MTVTSGTPDPSKQRDIQAELTELRRRIAELERAKQQLERHATTTTHVPEVAPPVTTTEELSQTLQAFVRRVAMILQAEKCVIMLYERDSNELVAQQPALKLTDEEIAGFRVHMEAGITGEVYRDAQPVICHDCATDPRAQQEHLEGLGVRDSLSVPMIIERRNENQQVVERKPIGVIHVFNKRYGLQFAEEDIRLLTVLGRNAAAVISSARAFLAIASEKKQLEYTLASMNSGLLSISRSARIQLANSLAADLLQLDANHGIGSLYHEAIANEEIKEYLAVALEQREELAQEFQVGERFYRGQTAKIRDEKGTILGLLCVFNDITELRNVERMKSDFVSTVSHELRTPLTAIKGFIRTLLDDPTGEFYDQSTRMEFYGIIDSECDRLVRLISDLLNVSRIERGLPLHLNFDTVDAAALVEKCVSFQRSYTHNHELVVDIAANLPTIMADKDKLDQVLTNLISNAIKYSPEGGSVTIRVVDEGDKLCFSVTDQGMGIPPEHLEKVFQRFHRVHSGDSQRVGGTGIGLYLAKNLVDAHNGVIWVDSTIGKGSTFSFTIPKEQPKAES